MAVYVQEAKEFAANTKEFAVLVQKQPCGNICSAIEFS
jgi:hypothetical protein